MISLLKKYGLGDPQTLADFAGVNPKIASRWITGTEDLPAYLVSLLTALKDKQIGTMKKYTPEMKAYMLVLFQSAKSGNMNTDAFRQNLKKLSKQSARQQSAR